MEASVKPTPLTMTSTPPDNCPKPGMISVIAYEGPTILLTLRACKSLNHPLFQPPNTNSLDYF
jgi:hypothetical protein